MLAAGGDEPVSENDSAKAELKHGCTKIGEIGCRGPAGGASYEGVKPRLQTMDACAKINLANRKNKTKTGTVNPIKKVLDQLAEAGFKRSYVRRVVLPEWWDDEIAVNAAGLQQGIGLITRHLGLKFAPLYTHGRVTFQTEGSVRFKHPKGAVKGELALAQSIALQALRLTCFKTHKPFTGIPSSASAIRDAILSRGAGGVNLENLLDYCWEHGIVVLHACNFPAGARKMEGLATLQAGRPGVVLCKQHQSPAWMVFILAHEIGHIARGHIPSEGVLVDQAVDPASGDREENEANQFAIELLTGSPDMRFCAPRYADAARLAQAANSVGRQAKVDPGVVALNYAWQAKRFALANAALKMIEPQNSAIPLIHQRMQTGLKWEEIPETNREYISKVTGAKIPA